MRSINFNAISPSAKGLLLTKAVTTIPFATEAAALLWDAEQLKNRIREKVSKESFVWLLHFENRYRTIDSLLTPLAYRNVLEIASGFSFRGLQLCISDAITYFDTDLPDSITTKQQVVDKLKEKHHLEIKGTYWLMPLNALDAAAFQAIVDQFPAGPVAIVNEGLLMYLDEGERNLLLDRVGTIASPGSRIALDHAPGFFSRPSVTSTEDPSGDRAVVGNFARGFHTWHSIFRPISSMRRTPAFRRPT